MQNAIAEAKAQFVDLIRRAKAGEATVLTRYGRPAAQIVPAGRSACRPLIGAMEGTFAWPEDVFDGGAAIANRFARSASASA